MFSTKVNGQTVNIRVIPENYVNGLFLNGTRVLILEKDQNLEKLFQDTVVREELLTRLALMNPSVERPALSRLLAYALSSA